MPKYGQFCPVAKAAEIFGERWTLLIIRELLGGATRFSEFQRGLANASPTILVKRLRELEDAGIVCRKSKVGRQSAEYCLTTAGEDLMPMVEHMGNWANRWVSGRLQQDELDEYLLMADIQRRIQLQSLPLSSAVLHFHFSRARKHPKWWLVINDGEVDLCDKDPGLEPDFYVDTSIKLMIEIWLGRIPLNDARRSGRLKTAGHRGIERSMNQWLGRSIFVGKA